MQEQTQKRRVVARFIRDGRDICCVVATLRQPDPDPAVTRRVLESFYPTL